MTYRPRGMPARFMNGAPDIVRKNVIDIISDSAPLDYDVIFRQQDTPRGGASYGLNFDKYGDRGQHFYLTNYDMRAYRACQRRRRVAWLDLPEATRKSIVNYISDVE